MHVWYKISNENLFFLELLAFAINVILEATEKHQKTFLNDG